MNVLVLGSGGREHAIAWKISQSPDVNKIYVFPGNAGIEIDAELEKVSEKVIKNSQDILHFAIENNIEITVVGPEKYLVDGIVDDFKKNGLKIIGPTKEAAKLEGSKSEAKLFMTRNNIETAQYELFNESVKAIAYAKNCRFPLVIKADGLASGKGVFIVKSFDEAKKTIIDLIDLKILGDAGKKILIEEFINGKEVSFIVLTDGISIFPFPICQDYKKLNVGDLGPNTGGMGAYSPVDFVNNELSDKIIKDVIVPVVRGMENEGTPYSGFLYAGLIITPDGKIKVLEFNCRLGDPEAQVLMMLVKGDLYKLFHEMSNKNLHKYNSNNDFWYQESAMTVVAASEGYPSNPKLDKLIKLPEIKKNDKNLKIFHSGTTAINGKLLTSGGRVLSVTARGKNKKEVRFKVYEQLRKISFPGIYFRSDINI